LNFLKKIYSYINPVVLETYESEHNAELSVLLNKGRYMLCADNAIYSYEDKYTNFREAFLQINHEEHPFRRVLVLGFGLGSIPILLEKIYKQTFEITGVDIDESVVLLAQKYGMPKIRSSVTFHVADASIFVDLHTEKYDLVVSDIFINDLVPSVFETEEYLESLRNLLTENGLILYNRLYYNDKTKKSTDVFFENAFKNTFEDASFIEVKGNLILTNKKIG